MENSFFFSVLIALFGVITFLLLRLGRRWNSPSLNIHNLFIFWKIDERTYLLADALILLFCLLVAVLNILYGMIAANSPSVSNVGFDLIIIVAVLIIPLRTLFLYLLQTPKQRTPESVKRNN